jgi:type VI secretion system protein ImpK
MNTAGPFEERTAIIRPNPGGRRAEAPRQYPEPPGIAAAPEGAPVSAEILDVQSGLNPLVDAAQPILALVSRLATMISHDDLDGLRRRLAGEFAAFDKRAEAAGVRTEIRRASHYALCATVDDVAANTPWGGQNVWASQSMARTFHNDVSGGERFFHLLGHFERDPEAYGDAIELFYLCLSLGFQGRFGILPEGAAELATIRARLHRMIRRRRGELASELSPHWRGIAAPHRPLASRIPIWVLGGAAGLLLLLVFIGFRLALAGGSDDLFAQLSVVPKIQQPKLEMTQPPPPPPPPVPRRVAGFLEPEIREGLVTVQETPQNVVVRLRGTGLFAAGSATLDPRFLPVIDRIGAALVDEPGLAMVVGHTDNKPIRTVQFASNFELSLSRAEAVRRRLAQTMGSGDRISVAGRADAEPIADNATPQGREMNRRIEIIVLRGKLHR